MTSTGKNCPYCGSYIDVHRLPDIDKNCPHCGGYFDVYPKLQDRVATIQVPKNNGQTIEKQDSNIKVEYYDHKRKLEMDYSDVHLIVMIIILLIVAYIVGFSDVVIL